MKAFSYFINRHANILLSSFVQNNPNFSYPRHLASNLLIMANNHTSFAHHSPCLTEVKKEGDVLKQVEELLLYSSWNILFPDSK